MDSIQIILITLILGLVSVVGIYYIQNFELKSTKKPTFLIIGNNYSGKTTWFMKLQGKKKPTISSIEANYGEIRLPLSQDSIAKPFQIVDYPGYLKYDNLFKNLIEDINLKGVCFVIDSELNNFNKNLNLIAIKLFKILTITETYPNGKDFLFMVNKSDLFNSLPVNKIRTLLEAEMNKVIESELKNNEDELSFWHDLLPFKFEKLNGNMDFKSGSVLKGKTQDWENWLDEIVVNPQ
ncbi:signal recognition particle receptor subunit beta [[Candida] jaroonii]|uniref:Signal recognition particle receptor subunit beta n=1 Tax=[Candida] jaroonii TaxID=467808 RepID=A0ACA9Y478_9ASCO|nr:signal recognition particle receptor subunit beta [[Candida] jaroonii]